MKQPILVTGGAGYIGSHTCKALAAQGFTPVTLDNLSTGHRDFVQWGPLIQGDIADAALVKQVVQELRPLAVIHFAGLIAVGESVVNPAAYYRNNVVGSFHLFETLREAGVDKVVFSSTAACYGNPGITPITESCALLPINPYGCTKLAMEQLLQAYDPAYGVRSVIFRYFNACGADPEAQIGEAHEPETHLIPLALDVVLGRRPQLTINGQDYPTADGTCIRDYIHVLDLAEAHVLAVRHLLAGGASLACNLGQGQGHSVSEVANMVELVTKQPLTRSFGPRRPGDPPALVAAADLARSSLGFAAKHSSLDEIIATAWAWHQKRFG